MSSLKRIIFFSGYQPEHHGDIHLSKEYVRNIAIQLNGQGIECLYLSSIDPHIINISQVIPKKMDNYRYIMNKENFIDLCSNPESFFHEESNSLYINTWVGYFGIVGGGHGFHNFSSQMNMWKSICKSIELNFGINLTMTDNNFDYVAKIDENLLNEYIVPDGNKIFIANSTPWSGQSKMSNLKDTIDYLSNKYQSYTFICTEDIGVERKNVFYTDDLTKRREKGYNSLPEISKISESCNILFTNCSGPGTFLFTKNNLGDKNKTILCFVEGENCPHWSGLENVLSKNIWSPEDREEEICKIIEKEIIKKYGESND